MTIVANLNQSELNTNGPLSGAPSPATGIAALMETPYEVRGGGEIEGAPWFTALSEKRKGWWDSTQANNYERGIRQSTVEKYADSAHFLYELLQNAEDQSATQAIFSLDKGRLRFVHNGEPFTPQDVENITGLGNSVKPEQSNKIGRFGIGFKSVFTVTQRPRIYTYLNGAPFAFAIENLVVPVMIEDKAGICKPTQTQFTFPFSPENALDIYRHIRQRLQTLGADTLLFLRNLKTIRWIVDDIEEGILGAKRSADGRVIDLTAEVGPKGRCVKQPAVSYLAYSQELTHAEGADRNLAVSIAFRIENGKVVAEKGQSTANVYFPTREKTGLRFRLHAPFLLNDSRANIKDNSPENLAFIKACADLFAASLPDLKTRGFMTVELLNILPIRADDFDGSAFRPMYDAMYNVARTSEILPTQAGSSRSHVRAVNARLSDSRPLKSLIGERELTTLYEGSQKDPICWLHENIQKTVTPELWHYLMRVLEIDEVDSLKVARRMDGYFLTAMTDTWMAEFYAFLNEQPSLWRASSGPGRERGPLRTRPIIRLEAGTSNTGELHVVPFDEHGAPNAYLPLKAESAGFPTVKRNLLANVEAVKFFRDLGLKQPNVADRIVQHVLPRYMSVSPTIPEATYEADIREIADALAALPLESLDRHDLCRRLLELSFIRAVRADNPKISAFKKPIEVFARTPENLEWFSGNSSEWLVCPSLDKHDRWPVLQRAIGAFSSKCVASKPRVHIRSADGSGYVDITDARGAHERGVNGFDPEARIDELAHAMKHVTPEKTRLLWRLLVTNPYAISGVVEFSKTANFFAPVRTDKLSILGKICKESRWLQNKATGEFHHASDMRLADLPDNWDKISAGAKEVALRLGLTDPEEQAMADKYGVPVDVLSRMIEAYQRDPRIVDQLTIRPKPELPLTETPYSERRAAKIAQDVEDSADIAFEKRERSVRVSGGSVKAEAEAYLREKYTNADKQMVCQICEQEMPFDKEDGSPFFFTVPCLREIEKESKQNYLALCPLCAALYQFANWGNAPGSLRQAILRDPGPRFTLRLAGIEERVWFHPHHLGDLKSILTVAGVDRPTKF